MKNIKKIVALLISLTVILACVSVLVSANGQLHSSEDRITEEEVICSVCNGNGYVITTSCSVDSEGNSFTATAEAKECPVEDCCHGIIG